MADITLNLGKRSLAVTYGNWPWNFPVKIGASVLSKRNKFIPIGKGLLQLGWMTSEFEDDTLKRFSLLCRTGGPPDYAIGGSGHIVPTTDFDHPMRDVDTERLRNNQYEGLSIGYDDQRNDWGDVAIQWTPYLFWSMVKDKGSFDEIKSTDSYFNLKTTKKTRWTVIFKTGHLLEIV
jgi:hypothetical protein